MAQPQPQEQSLYGLPVPVTKAPTPPVIAKRDPVPSDTGYPLSQLWINNVLGSAWILTQVQGGLATWIPILGAGAGVQTIGGFLPTASNFNFVNLGGLTIGGAVGQFSAGVNVTGPVLSIVANSIEAQLSSASAVADPLLNGVAHFDSAQFTVNPDGFVQLAGGGLAIDQIAVDAFTGPGTNPVDPDGTGLVTITGGQVAAGTTANVIRSHSTAVNSLTIEVQRAAASAVSNVAVNGVAHFDSAAFTVDADGFVEMANGLPSSAFDVQANTAPGTDPVLPNALGVVQVNGSIVAAQSIPLRTNSLAANAYNIEAQYSSAAVGSSGANAGMASFDSAQFSVDASGWVQMANGLPVAGVDVQASTPPGTDPVLPNASGIIAVSGAQVAAAGIPIQTNSLAANSYEIQVQRSSAQAVSTISANGICHFDSSQFSVDADGFVQSLASVAFVWQDSGPITMSITNGYFATAAGVYTLPLGTADGQTIEIIDNIGGGVVVTASGAQTIRVQNVQSSAGGTCTSTQFGDALRLIYRASIGEWQTCPGAGGNWILA